MTENDAIKLADHIVAGLFSLHDGRFAQRLIQELPNGTRGGGWGSLPCRDFIAREIMAFKSAPDSLFGPTEKEH